MDLLQSELSASTLAALQQHLAEQEKGKETNEVDEDFRLSQFWYTDETAMVYAKEALEKCAGGSIALISAPAAMRAFKKLAPEKKNVYLLEFDKRFDQIYPGQFIFYDYNQPLQLPESILSSFDFLLADPPHLNKHTMEQYAKTMKSLARHVSDEGHIQTPSLLVTGTMLCDDIEQTLHFQPTGFSPTFSSKLSNHFYSYSNYSSTALGTLDDNQM